MRDIGRHGYIALVSRTRRRINLRMRFCRTGLLGISLELISLFLGQLASPDAPSQVSGLAGPLEFGLSDFPGVGSGQGESAGGALQPRFVPLPSVGIIILTINKVLRVLLTGAMAGTSPNIFGVLPSLGSASILCGLMLRK